MTSFFQTKSDKQFLYFSQAYHPNYEQNTSKLIQSVQSNKEFYEKRYGSDFENFYSLLKQVDDFVIFSKTLTKAVPCSFKGKVENMCGMNGILPAPKTLQELKSEFDALYPFMIKYIEARDKLTKIIPSKMKSYFQEKEAYRKSVTNIKNFSYIAYQEGDKKAEQKFPFTLEQSFGYHTPTFTKTNINKIKKVLEKDDISDLSSSSSENENKSYAILLSDKELWYAEKDYMFPAINEARFFSTVEAAQKRAKKLGYSDFNVVGVEVKINLNDVHHFGKNKGEKMTKMLIEHERKSITEHISYRPEGDTLGSAELPAKQVKKVKTL